MENTDTNMKPDEDAGEDSWVCAECGEAYSEITGPCVCGGQVFNEVMESRTLTADGDGEKDSRGSSWW